MNVLIRNKIQGTRKQEPRFKKGRKTAKDSDSFISGENSIEIQKITVGKYF